MSQMRKSELQGKGLDVLDMPLIKFTSVVSTTGHPKWYEIGLELGFELSKLEGLKHNNLHRCDTYRLQTLLQTYYEKKGDTNEMRKDVLRACIYFGIEGSLRDAIQKEGYSWTF